MFIVFEGIDGSGKTTQAKLLYKHFLANKSTKTKCILTNEPTNGNIGKSVKSLIKKSSINPTAIQLLFMADRAEHAAVIKEWIKENKIIVCDRYYFSTIAYGHALGLSKNWLETVNSIFPKPDFTIILDVDPATALARVNSRKEPKQYFEKAKFLDKVRKEYKSLSKQYNNIFIIKCNERTTVSQIHTEVMEIISSMAPFV